MEALSRRQIRNVALLALAWSMAVAALFIVVSSGTSFARELEGNNMATLPIGVLVCCATLSTLIAPQVIKFVSRRFLFISSSVLGIVGAGVMSFAVHDDSFLIFTIAAAPLGIAYGISNLYRFYATDSSLPENREKALAATVGGAVLSAFIGPEASRHVRDALNPDFFGAFLLATGLWVLQLLLVSSVDYRLPKHIAAHIKRQEAEDKGDTLGPMYTEPTVMSPVKRDEPTEGSDSRVDLQNPLFKDVGRQPIDPPHVVAAHHDSTIASIAGGSTLGSTLQAPSLKYELRDVSWTRIAGRPGFLVAAAVASLSFFGMAGLMAATPLSMTEAGYSVDSSTLVIEAHIIAMYLPSLFSGQLVKRLGASTMMVCGSTLIVGGTAFFFYSEDRFVFWVSLVMIGIGWNFDYVGSSNEMLNSLDHPAEKGPAQAMFDFIALSGLSVAILSAGFTFEDLGWELMYQVYLGINALTLLGSLLYALSGCIPSAIDAYGDGT